MKKGIAALTIAATIALAGCGTSGVQLDKEVNVSGMTVSVPSVWEESDHGGTLTFDGPMDDEGHVSDAIIISFEDADGQSIDDYAGDVYEGAEQVSTGEVDEHGYAIYDFNGEDVAIIEGDSTIYDVMALGDAVSLESVIDSVSFGD